MGGHAIEGEAVVCLEPETALCRAKWDCDCEYYSTLEFDRQRMLWFHVVCDYEGTEVEHYSIGHLEPQHCNMRTWLHNDGPVDCWADGYEYPLYGLLRSIGDPVLVDGPIEVEWGDESYIWRYTDPRSVGTMIGRLVVQKWEYDKDLVA